jgi:chromosomal replication initiation ATPase DnaA
MITQITPKNIELAVANTFNTNIKKVLQPSAEKHIATPRQILFLLMAELDVVSPYHLHKRYKYHSDPPGMYRCIRNTRKKLTYDPTFRKQLKQTINTLNTIINP